MTTFDLNQVRKFTSDISDRMSDRREPMEGMEGARMDAIFRRYAELCRELCVHVRKWGYAVFSGRIVFDPEVECLWREGGSEILHQAKFAWECGQIAEKTYFMEGPNDLQDAIDELERLLQGWVTPKLAVGPAAKRWRYPDQAATDAERQLVASLPALPPDWEPEDPRQRILYRNLQGS